VASDPYPSNDKLPGLNSQSSLAPNSSFTYIFEQSGTFTYHDAQNPLKVLGTIQVR
jgi:hypothetical protein